MAIQLVGMTRIMCEHRADKPSTLDASTNHFNRNTVNGITSWSSVLVLDMPAGLEKAYSAAAHGGHGPACRRRTDYLNQK